MPDNHTRKVEEPTEADKQETKKVEPAEKDTADVILDWFGHFF